MSQDVPQEPVKRYAVRLIHSATDDLHYHRDRLATLADDATADQWLSGLLEAISHLASAPFRPVSPKTGMFSCEVRAFVYRRPGSSVSHRILFTIREASQDGPLVVILHIRHGTAGPIQRYEARNTQAHLDETGV
jgi:hypothetical protein